MIEECLMAEFRVAGDDCPLSTASRQASVVVDAAPPLLRDDGKSLVRFSADPSETLTDHLDENPELQYLHRSRADGRHNYRCLSHRPCVVHRLVNAGFMVESITYDDDGEGRFTGAVVGQEVLRSVLETAGETVGATLDRVYALGSDDDTTVAQRWSLTPAQTESLELAHDLGYFRVPREATAGEVAEHLGISKTAFLERLRRGQHQLFAQALS